MKTMDKFMRVSCTVLLLCFIGWTTPAQQSVPSGWRKIDADGKFSFYLPPSMRDTGSRGIENFHREYTNGRMQVGFDYEPYGHLAYENRAIAFGKDFEETELQVDGKKSFMFVYQSKDWKKRRTYNAVLYVGDLPDSDVLMSMLVTSRSPQVIETAKAIFRTIKFPPASKSSVERVSPALAR